MKKGIIFDMDGTLWDSAEQVAKAWNIAAAGFGYEYNITTEDIMAVMGKPMDELADIIFKQKDIEVRNKLLQVCGDYENEYLRINGGTLYPELRATMEKLKEMGYHLYIVSNCQDGYVQAFLNYHKLWEYFDDIEMSGRTGKCKGENIKMVIERNNLDEAVYVGDTNGDLEAADYAGIPFIYAKYGFGNVENQKYILDSLCDINTLISKIL